MLILKIIGVILLVIFALIGFGFFCCLIIAKREDEKTNPPQNWCGEEPINPEWTQTMTKEKFEEYVDQKKKENPEKCLFDE